MNGQKDETTQRPAARPVSPIRSGLGLIAFAVVWFGLAGGPTWLQGWLLLLGFTGTVGLLAWRLAHLDPDLLQERNQPAANITLWDRRVIRWYGMLGLTVLALAALDSGRFSWSRVPLWAQLTGWLVLCLAAAMIYHVMGINAYLSSWARAQDDRGQVVVQDGLYSVIRHPMYLSIMLSFIALPLALASWWALLPGLLVVALFVYRTAREDRILYDELPGYAAYAGRVRYRLLPGIW